jgi:hypothetical protein
MEMKMLSLKGGMQLHQQYTLMERARRNGQLRGHRKSGNLTVSGDINPMHIHAVQFQVVKRTGGRNRILPHETGWKTTLVVPGEKCK